MKVSRPTYVAVLALVAWLALTWKLSSTLGLQPPILYYLQAGLWLIGIAGLIGYFFLRPSPEEDAPSTAGTDIDDAFAEGAQRMRTAQGVKQLNALPAVFLLGDSGSAKTSILAKGGLEPELLAGAAYQDQNDVVTPTRALNLWYSRQTLFIDPAGALVGDEAARRKLFKKFAPQRMNSAFSAKQTPTRSVVITVDTETFLQEGGAETLAAKSRQFQKILGELSAELGSSFPVYVLFTKIDKIPYFRDFAENLTDGEASDIFGAALPMEPAGGGGVYAEAQTRRVTNAFQELYYELSDRRPNYLAREHDPAKLPNVYEFPREFAKLKPLLVPFLVDLCRPSQLGTTPFLRGFYFTGVRPITVADLVPAAQAPVVEEGAGLDTGATRIFNPRAKAALGLVEPQTGAAGARRIPQWVFLGRLFSHVILADQPAAAVTQQNVKVNFARRVLLGATTALALSAATWLIVSYSNNRALVSNAVESARGVPAAGLPSGRLAALDSLQRLTRVRDTLDTLNRYGREGAPFRYGAFLYAGDAIRQPLRTTYYALFRKLLLAPTQETLVGVCMKPEGQAAQEYSYLYNALKAYLITTNHHEKSTADFLPPVLSQYWYNGQTVDNDRQYLVRRNFEFYADELRDANPFPRYDKPDDVAVENARAFLKRFKGEERIYQALLAEAGRGQKPIVFNVDYPGSAETVLNTYRVEPAFTQTGAAIFAKALEDPARSFRGEEWVLGEPINAAQDRQKLITNLGEQYGRDLARIWREYLHATSLAPFKDVPDAASKLAKLSSPESALLRVLCVASENTKTAAGAFQPVQFITPLGCSGKLVNPANSPYMQGLINLQTALQTVGPIENAAPGNIDAANNAVTQAENIVKSLALNFTPDAADPKSNVLSQTAQLLRDPIASVPPLLKAGVGAAANAAAAGMCNSIRPILNKYPFKKSDVDATLGEVNGFLKPQDGQLWQLYNAHLKQYLVLAGDDYVRAPGQQGAVTDSFLRFFNRAARMSKAMYKPDSQQPSAGFSMQVLPSPDVTHVTLSIHGQMLSTDLTNGAHSQAFTWPGTAASAHLGVSFGGNSEFDIENTHGLWAIWRLLDDGERLPDSGGQMQAQWTERNNKGVITQVNGHPASVKFALDSQSSQIFRPQYFSNLGCAGKAIQ